MGSGDSTEFSRRLDQIQPFHVMRLLEKARQLEAQGKDVIHMEVGEPDFPTPEPIIKAGQEALARGKTFYTPALGLPELRAKISRYYAEKFQVTISPQRIVITPGASGALQLLMALLVNSGAPVLMADPGYPCNRNLAFLYEASPIGIDVSGDNFQLASHHIQDNWPELGCPTVLVTTPSNPTGRVISRADLVQIHQLVKERQGNLIVDEIYQGLTYGIDEFTAASLGDDLYVVNSFSKFFGMTGWRLGWLIAPEEAIPALDRLAQNLFLAPSTIAQYAALAAFQPETAEILEQRRQRFEERRDFLYPAINELGFTCTAKPEGAFYLFADCRKMGWDSDELAENLLEHAAVAITPGKDFCVRNSERYVRFAFTTETARLEQGVERIRRFLSAGG